MHTSAASGEEGWGHNVVFLGKNHGVLDRKNGENKAEACEQPTHLETWLAAKTREIKREKGGNPAETAAIASSFFRGFLIWI